MFDRLISRLRRLHSQSCFNTAAANRTEDGAGCEAAQEPDMFPSSRGYEYSTFVAFAVLKGAGE